jgi:outer membrane protein assembly factor BamE (lipoprotein component of BamABCDE complex)
MRKQFQAAACFALAAMLAGCASSGNGTVRTLSQQGAAQSIAVGKSTKADISAAFGAAEVSRFDNGYELWLYQIGLSKMVDSLPYLNLVLNSADNRKELSILFDRSGVVKKYQLRDE